MADYAKITNYAAKDLLLHGDPAKAVKGTEVGAEFDAIATMSATKGDKSGTLAQFAATTSLELKGVISDETGSGALVFATSPTLVTPTLGTPASGTLTNCTGLPANAVVNTPAGSIAATTVQAAINELDTEKATLAGSATQAFAMVTAAANTNSTQGATTAYADRLTAGTLPGAFTSLNASGTLDLGGAGTSGGLYTGELGIPNSAGIRSRNSTNTVYTNLLYLNGSDVLQFASAGNASVFGGGLAVTGQVSPSAHNTYDLGTTGVRWKDLWLQSGAFNGSDARLKTAIAPLTTNEINAAKQLSKEIGTYQWLESVQKKGTLAARHHVGFTVQRAIEILQLNGCDPFSYGFIGYDKWEDVFVEHAEILPVAAIEAKEAVLDVDGNIVEPAVAAVEAVVGKAAWTEHKTVAGDAYSFRYDQLNMFIAAGLEARLAALEAK